MAKIFLMYLCAGLLAFANGLSGPFMLDDHAFFTPEVRDIRYLPQHFIPKAYKTDVASGVPHGQPNFYYRPFAKIIPSVSYAMFGQNMVFYHLFNLVLLVGAGFMIFYFLLVSGVLGRRGAIAAGLLYIVHPINGIMVNYITASVFAAQLGFMLLSLIFMQGLKFPRVPASQENENWGTGVLGAGCSVLFFTLALMCHETAVLLPLYAVVLFYVREREGAFNGKIGVSVRKTWFLWVVAAAWLVFRFSYASLGDGLLAKFTRFEMNAFEHIASVGKLIFWYLSKLAFGWDIVLIWAMPVVRGGEVLFWFAAAIMLVAVVILLILRWRHERSVVIGLIWLMAGFLPLPLMCLFQPTHGPMIEPHWFVFSSIGFLMIAARTASTPGVAVVLAIFLVVGWRHNHLWADEQRYAHYWAQQAPSIRSVWFHLGDIYFKEQKYKQAADHYEQSVRGTYQDYLAYQRMGLAYFNLKDFRRAQVNFMLSLRLEPRQPVIRERLNWIEKHASKVASSVALRAPSSLAYTMAQPGQAQ